MRTFDEIYTNLEELIRDDYRSVVKALLSIEYGIYDDADLDVLYDEYMQNDTMTLLNEGFERLIVKHRIATESEE
jgi:hypothetical protein